MIVITNCGNMVKKRQVCFRVDDETFEEIEQISRDSGISISNIIEARLKGWDIIKNKKK